MNLARTGGPSCAARVQRVPATGEEGWGTYSDRAGRYVASAQPDDFWWRAPDQGRVFEVIVLGDDHKPFRVSDRPDFRIGQTSAAPLANLFAARKQVREPGD